MDFDAHHQGYARRGSRSGYLLAAMRVQLAWARLAQIERWKAGFNPDQPRDDHGRWTDAGDDSDGQTIDLSAASRKAEIVRKFGAWTARQFISQYCRGSISREFPGEFEHATLGDIWELAKGGDARARTCQKLLQQPRFRK